MSTSVSQSIYKYSDGGDRVYYQVLPDYNVSSQLTKVTNPQEVVDYVNYLKTLGPYTAGSRSGVQFDPQPVIQMAQQAIQQYSSNPNSEYVLDNSGNFTTQAKLDATAQGQSGVAAGTMKNIGTADAPLYVPAGTNNQNQPQPNPSQTPPQTSGDITGGSGGQNISNLYSAVIPGQNSAQVKQLQQALISQGYSIPQGATGFFGPETQAAVNQWKSTLTGTPQNNQTSQNTQNTPTGSQNTPSASPTSTTGNPTIDAIITQLQGSSDPQAKLFATTIQGLQSGLNKLISQGTTINPAVNITPDTVAAFMTVAQNNSDIFSPYATSQIDPYYKSQLAQAKQSFLSSVGYSVQQQQQMEQDLQKTYGQSLKDIGTSAADQGFAQSGIRSKQESDLAYQTNRQIQSSRSSLIQNATGQAQQFASLYGGANVPQQSILQAPEASGGSPLGLNTGTQPLYNLSDSVYQGLQGSQQYQEQADISSRASQLESAFRQNAATQQQRNITL
jgi:hypothetical protein